MVSTTRESAETKPVFNNDKVFEDEDSACCGCCGELAQALSIAWNELKMGFDKLFSFTKPAQPDLKTIPIREHGKADLLDKLRSIDKEIESASRELSKLKLANLFTSLNDRNESDSGLTVLATIKVMKDETQPNGNNTPPSAEAVNKEVEKLKTAKKSQQGELLNKLALKEERLSSLKAERETLIRKLNELTDNFNSRQKALSRGLF